MNINQAYPSKYLKAADLKGHPPVTVVIRNITREEMEENKPESIKPVIWFDGKDKGFACNKTNAMMIAHTYGDETDAWIGKSIQIRCEPVEFKGKIVDSIRVAVAQVQQSEARVYAGEQDATAKTMDENMGDFDDDIPF